MANVVIGLFDDAAEAQRAYSEVINLGIPKADVSVIARGAEGEAVKNTGDGSEADSGFGVGASLGTLAGGAAGILASLGLIAIPGIGPLLAAGPIVAALTGAGVGAVTGGVVGALIGWGIPEHEAEVYDEGVRRGGVVVTAKAQSEHIAEQISEVMREEGAVDIDSRAAQWRQTGWQSKYGTTGSATSTGGRNAGDEGLASNGGRSIPNPGESTSLEPESGAPRSGRARVYNYGSGI